MNKFQPKVYLFCDYYDQRLEGVFGLTNMSTFKLIESNDFKDECTENLVDIVTNHYHNYQYLITAKYDPKHITAIIMMGMDLRIFLVKNLKSHKKILELGNLLKKLDNLSDSASYYFADLERTLTQSEGLLRDSSFNDLNDRNVDIVNFGDDFESIVSHGIWDVLVKDYGISV